MTKARGSAAAADGVRVRLYDADGKDRDVPLADGLAAGLGSKKLLWIDVVGRTKTDLEGVAGAVGLEDSLADRLATEPERAGLTQHPDFIHLAIRRDGRIAEGETGLGG